ncbi:hypothetical protein PV350_04905 [Streptomyces sp. PA03-6a]|nr:hypothetical protein [Streptomyces sp. PA03-6a]
MKYSVVHTSPAEEIAATATTLDELTASLRAALTERFGEPITTAEIGEYGGFPLVSDESLPRGVVHFRPAARPVIPLPLLTTVCEQDHGESPFGWTEPTP